MVTLEKKVKNAYSCVPWNPFPMDIWTGSFQILVPTVDTQEPLPNACSELNHSFPINHLQIMLIVPLSMKLRYVLFSLSFSVPTFCPEIFSERLFIYSTPNFVEMLNTNTTCVCKLGDLVFSYWYVRKWWPFVDIFYWYFWIFSQSPTNIGCV